MAVGTVKRSIDVSEPTCLSRNVRRVCEGGLRSPAVAASTGPSGSRSIGTG